MNSVDNPVGFLLCYGEIIRKETHQLTTVYSIQLLGLLDDKKTLLHQFNLQKFHIQFAKSRTFGTAKINILDICDDINFQEKLVKKTSKYLYQAASYLTSKNQAFAEELQNNSKQLSKTFLEDLLVNLK